MPQIPPLKMLTSQWFNHCSCQRGNATGLGNDTPFNMPGAGQQNKYKEPPGRGSQQWVLLCLPSGLRHHQMWAGVLDKGKQTTFFLCCLFTVERNFHCTIPKGNAKKNMVGCWGCQCEEDSCCLRGQWRESLLEATHHSVVHSVSTFQVNKLRNLVEIYKTGKSQDFISHSSFPPFSFFTESSEKNLNTFEWAARSDYILEIQTYVLFSACI